MQEGKPLRHPCELYRYARKCLEGNQQIVVATVISRSGSGPREPGTSMIIENDGKTLGTIGGGILEAKTLETAKIALRHRRSFCRTFLLTDEEASENGMLCGGQMEILVEYMDGSDPAVREIFNKLLQYEKKGLPCRLIRSIRRAGSEDEAATGLGIVDEAGWERGSLSVTGPDMENFAKQCRGKEPALIQRDDVRYFIQQMEIPETVFIFGAGHVGQELATVCHLAGFRTVVIDDRREFANAERFPKADEIIVPDSFAESFAGLSVNASSYVVIVTRGHAFDQCVLSAALRTSAGYIGMIASRRKRDIIFRSLLEDGVSSNDMEFVHSPIGIDIGARTPAEIAVSIAAELISVRAGRNKRKNGNKE